MPFRQTMQRFAAEKFLCDLPLELDAMGSVFCHGFYPSKARHPSQFIPTLPSGPRGPLQKCVNNCHRWYKDDDPRVYLRAVIDDPSLSEPLRLARFEENGKLNLVWRRLGVISSAELIWCTG